MKIPTLLTITATFLSLHSLHASDLPIPNFSFESQSGVGQPFGVNVFIDSWQKNPKPAYFDESSGFYWMQTAGVFLNPPTNYQNALGAQAAYLLPFPGNGLFQDFTSQDWNDSTPTNDFNATFQTGKSYQFTLGVFGKNLSEGDTLQLSLYYRDSGNNPVTVGSPNQIVYHLANFPTANPFNLIDFSVMIPEVQATDPFAGQTIGISISSPVGSGSGNWDFDNARLTATPEPTSLLLLSFGVVSLALRRHRSFTP
ncbi:MAG: PEP-CTERM sorting domain-containing protein [Verrucomicrobia bacterium]|nr:PEP-CTERM sorting domain-containing protein [Verrucomicrobiota bacterium]